ncbi:MAG: hypothetical protein LBL62_06390 [Planctomycetaceae bacterium]|jgi:hypothetical protein|nr:hypothetical protein [Planctomycetaceae bacterium]
MIPNNIGIPVAPPDPEPPKSVSTTGTAIRCDFGNNRISITVFDIRVFKTITAVPLSR